MNRLRLGLLACGVFGSISLMRAQGPSAAAPIGPSPEMVTPGELLIEPATLINLGFEWFIQGDSNRNAVVEVSYRKTGATATGSRRCRCCASRASASTPSRAWT